MTKILKKGKETHTKKNGFAVMMLRNLRELQPLLYIRGRDRERKGEITPRHCNLLMCLIRHLFLDTKKGSFII